MFSVVLSAFSVSLWLFDVSLYSVLRFAFLVVVFAFLVVSVSVVGWKKRRVLYRERFCSLFCLVLGFIVVGFGVELVAVPMFISAVFCLCFLFYMVEGF